jgi:hypothetical protein
VKFDSFVLASAAVVVALITSLSGCGQSEQQTVARGAVLSRQILQLEQGASVDAVKNQLGEPKSETNKSVHAGLNYGIWQLTFVHDGLTTRSKVIVPQNGRPIEGNRALGRKILRLRLGTRLEAAEEKLGTPEVVYVVYEGAPQPIKILGYFPWELTFINGKLSQRSQ